VGKSSLADCKGKKFGKHACHLDFKKNQNGLSLCTFSPAEDLLDEFYFALQSLISA
jgi:hypothetical protein